MKNMNMDNGILTAGGASAKTAVRLEKSTEQGGGGGIVRFKKTALLLAATALICAFAACVQNADEGEKPKSDPKTVPADLTQFSFGTTEANSSRTAVAVDAKTVTVRAVDAETTYFTITKTAGQTITAGGEDAAKVTVHASGTADGSAATGELAVIEVDTGGEYALFEGCARSFTLVVSEAGQDDKAISVALSSGPDPDAEATVFIVRRADDPRPALWDDKLIGMPADFPAGTDEASQTYPVFQPDFRGKPASEASRAFNKGHEDWALRGTKSGALEPVRDMKKWDLETEAYTEAPGTTLLDALVWIDQHAETDGEYLVRLNKDASIPSIILTCKGAENVTIRLRGYGAERVITYNEQGIANPGYGLPFDYMNAKLTNIYWNPDETWFGNYNLYNDSAPGGRSLISVGYYKPHNSAEGTPFVDYNMTLELENNATLKGNDSENGWNDMFVANMLNISKASTLIMLDGSKVMNHMNASSAATWAAMIYVANNSYTEVFTGDPSLEKTARFYMYGGTIEGYKESTQSGALYPVMPVYFVGKPEFYFHTKPANARERAAVFFFFKTGGSIRNNEYKSTLTDSQKTYSNKNLFQYNPYLYNKPISPNGVRVYTDPTHVHEIKDDTVYKLPAKPWGTWTLDE